MDDESRTRKRDRMRSFVLGGLVGAGAAVAAGRRLRPRPRPARDAGRARRLRGRAVLPRARRARARGRVVAEPLGDAVHRREVDVGVADLERHPGDLRRRRELDPPLGRADRLARPYHQVRPERPRLERARAARGRRRTMLSALSDVRRVGGVEDPDAAAERPRRVQQRVGRELRVGAREDDPRELCPPLPGVEEHGLVAEQDVVRLRRVGAARRPRPCARPPARPARPRTAAASSATPTSPRRGRGAPPRRTRPAPHPHGRSVRCGRAPPRRASRRTGA